MLAIVCFKQLLNIAFRDMQLPESVNELIERFVGGRLAIRLFQVAQITRRDLRLLREIFNIESSPSPASLDNFTQHTRKFTHKSVSFSPIRETVPAKIMRIPSKYCQDKNKSFMILFYTIIFCQKRSFLEIFYHKKYFIKTIFF